jgi:DNA-binding NarL/FixJ family response regulator
VLTTYDTDADILRAVEAGAVGYLLKDATKQELADAVRGRRPRRDRARPGGGGAADEQPAAAA